MMRTLFALTVIFALILSGCATAPKGSVLGATIHRDCGPADGPAFTVEIPVDGGGRLIVSIWRAPEIAGPTTFTLTDPTDATGSASVLRNGAALDTLRGTITFEGVNPDEPVSGSFSLQSASGESFEGSFTAEWVEFNALCG